MTLDENYTNANATLTPSYNITSKYNGIIPTVLIPTIVDYYQYSTTNPNHKPEKVNMPRWGGALQHFHLTNSITVQAQPFCSNSSTTVVAVVRIAKDKL